MQDGGPSSLLKFGQGQWCILTPGIDQSLNSLPPKNNKIIFSTNYEKNPIIIMLMMMIMTREETQ